MSTLLRIRLEQRSGALLVGVALAAVALLLMLPSVAEAQEEQQEVQRQTISVEGAQPAHEPAERLVVAPGDSLWSISQQRLHPNATPQQIMNEVGRIYELNRSRIGDDPNYLLVGQELLVGPVAEPPTTAATAPTAAEPTTVAVVEEEPAALPDPPQVEEGPAAAPSYTVNAESSPETYYFMGVELRMLGAAAAGVGTGALMLALILAIITAWKKTMARKNASRGDYYDTEEQNNQKLLAPEAEDKAPPPPWRCEHDYPIRVVATESGGKRARCLGCKELGPEGEDAEQAVERLVGRPKEQWGTLIAVYPRKRHVGD